jgi:hypothetical protein
MPELVTTNKYRDVIIAIGSSNKNANWLKYINKGKHKKDDLAAHDAALAKHKKESNA